MKLTHKSYKSNFSTCTGTPVYTPPKLQKSTFFEPKVFQQKLRVRNKQTIHKNPKIKCNKKSQPIINFKKFIKNQQQSRQVDWITYNLLNGIYQNWIRLAPSIIHLIQASKKDKLHDIQKLMQRVYEQKQRIQKLINKIKCPRQSFQYFHKKQSHNQQIINLQILDRINIICKQFKCTTQLMNGQIFAQKRIIKSQKENILADYLFSDLIKINRQNKNVFIDDNVTKVAETIVDRIAVVKSLKSKNIKVDKKILKPLQKIFTGLESSKLQKEPITIDKVIKQIIQKFVKTKNTHQNEQNTSNKEVKNLKITFNQSQKNYQIKNQGKQGQRQDIISLKLILDDIQDKYQTSMANKMQLIKSTTKKKIGFKIDTQSESEQHIKFDKKRTDMLLFNQRKANLDRQMVKNKNKSKNKLIYNLLDQQQDPITRLKQSKFQIKKSNKSQKNCLNQIKSEQDDNQCKKGHNLQSNFQKDSQIKQNLTKKVLSRQYSYQYTSESQEQQIQFNTQNGKYQKLKKNIRKRNLKKHPYAFDLFDLQNFDMELKAQQNVVIKKKKILDLFNTLQAGGVSGSKSIKKILTYAQKIEQQIKTRNNIFKQKMMRNNLSQDGEIASFFRIPYFDANKNNQYSTHSCKPYQYLTKFNKQAVSNWNNHAMRMFRLSDVPKARFSELGCDLNIPIIKKQTIYQDRRWIDRQNKALQFSLQLIRRRNKMAIQQKPLFIQKQNII